MMQAKSTKIESHSQEITDLLSMDDGPLDAPMEVTFFGNRRAMRHREKTLSLRDLADRVKRTKAKDKDSMQHVKLSRFSGETTAKGSFRHNAAHVALTGIEGDYDAGEMSVKQAVAALAKAGIASLIYTTPSHVQNGKGNRWRILCPLSGETTPADHNQLTARLNGALGGVLSDESFTATQSYAFGTVEGLESSLDIQLVDGLFLDECSDLDAGATGKIRLDRGAPETAEDLSGDEWRVEQAVTMLESAADRLADEMVARNTALCKEAFLAGGLLANNLVNREQIMDAFLPAMATNGYLNDHAGGDTAEVERIIDAQIGAGSREPFDPGRGIDDFDDLDDDEPSIDDLLCLDDDASIVDLLDTTPPDMPPKGDSTLTFLTPADCGLADPRPYIVKGLIAKRDVGCIVGAPGVGKSVLGPAIAYAVAQGREMHGRRTAQGGVFYVAAEDEYGMRGRVTALMNEHGDADAFTLVSGVSNLLPDVAKGKATRSRDHLALRSAIKERRPSLVVIDTLAMSFPGLEENSAEGMGRVVSVARDLTNWGAAVILIHHDTKDGANGLPRGHSLLNGALDLSIHLTKKSDVVSGRLTKNRNGACDVDLAFMIHGAEIGTDADGDKVTAAICEELDASTFTDAPKLRPQAQDALDLFREVAGENGELSEDEWRDVVIHSTRVSPSDKIGTRQTAFQRVNRELRKAKLLIVSDEIYRLNSHNEDEANDFDDLPN